MIAIIDYDMGNLKSVSKAFEAVGARVCVTRDIKKIRDAEKIVLPGVGAFPKCMENLKNYGLIDIIKEEIKKGKPFLGICLGLQLLFEEGEEFGPSPGLGILKGKVKKFDFSEFCHSRESGNPGNQNLDPRLRGGDISNLKIPHMGWNQIQKKGNPTLLKGIENDSSFYFVHSYCVAPKEKSIVATETDYGGLFCSSIEKDNVLACQFHPEKSQKLGLKVLQNFAELK
ncbi:MAG: imidazole glycerol phosphate synthase subunit HisH [Deltaproteobacteria bacterium]|nr:imidazole glycerol phosphate synthase subunit HisH [Deltaproteobacteria bacterium]